MKRALIIYLSQTGNTEKVASMIKKGMESKFEIDIIKFKDAKRDPEFITKYEIILVGVPVFYFRPAFSVMDFLDALPEVTNKFGFVFLTSGGNPGNTLYRMAKVLNQKGITVIDGFSCLGKDTHQLYSENERIFQADHPNEEELELARQAGMLFTEKYEKALHGETFEPDFYKKDSTWAKLLRYKDLNNEDIFPKRIIDEDACTQCGTCVDECHADAITLDPYPVFSETCDRCYWCERACPHQAIKCDWTKQIAFFNKLREIRKEVKGK